MTDYDATRDMTFAEVHDFHFLAIRRSRSGGEFTIYDIKKVSGGWVVSSKATGEPAATRSTLDDAKGFCLGARRWPF